jgi:hypothetical protein
MTVSFGVMEKAVAQMARMGFSRSSSVSTLEKHGGNVHHAINELLSNPVELELSRPALTEPEPEITELGPAEMDTVGRLRQRLAHQGATLQMLRNAGASAEELQVLTADVAELEAQLRGHDTNRAAMLAAREHARRMQDEAARRAREVAQARAAAAERKSAELARAEEQLREAARLAADAAEEEMAAADAAQAADDEAAAQLLQSCVAAEWRAAFEPPQVDTDASGAEYVIYPVTVVTPHGTHELRKRYSDFEALKLELACSDVAKEAALGDTPFPAKTWTSWIMADGDAVAQERREVLSVWLNVVLMICPDSTPVVQFVAGEQGLLQSVM